MKFYGGRTGKKALSSRSISNKHLDQARLRNSVEVPKGVHQPHRVVANADVELRLRVVWQRLLRPAVVVVRGTTREEHNDHARMSPKASIVLPHAPVGPNLPHGATAAPACASAPPGEQCIRARCAHPRPRALPTPSVTPSALASNPDLRSPLSATVARASYCST